MSYLNIGGKNIYFEEYGKGKSPTLVYFHGGPGESCRTYTYQAKVLGESCHVISFDQYGVFRSDALGDEKAGVRFHVELIEQMRLALGIDKWIPLGHSFGGMLALVYAHNYSEHTEAVIYDCPMWSALHTARAIASASLPFYEEKGMTEQADICRDILSEGISPQTAFEKALGLEMGEELQKYLHAIDMADYNRYVEEHIPDIDAPEECWYRYIDFTKRLFEQEDFYENYIPLIAKVEKPQMLIVGEYDMTCGKPEQEYFIQNAPLGRYEEFKGSAHLSWFERPEEYTKIITGFAKGFE